MKIQLPKNLGYKALETLATAATFCAPVSTGYVVWRALVNEKKFIPNVALITATGLEFLGFTTANAALTHHNLDTREKKGVTLPTILAVIALFAYVIVAMILTWVIEQDPVLALFPLLSLVGSATLAIIQEIKRRELSLETVNVQVEIARQAEQEARLEAMRLEKQQQVERDRLAAERQARLDQAAHEEALAKIEARKVTKIAKLQSVTPTVTPTGESGGNTVGKTVGDTVPPTAPQERRDQLHTLIASGDKPNISELARSWGVSRKTIYDDIELVTRNGKNGNGAH